MKGLALVVVGSVLTLLLLGLLGGGDDSKEGSLLMTLSLVAMQILLLVAVWRFGIKRYRVSWQAIGFTQPRARWSLLLPWLALALSLVFGGFYAAFVNAMGLDSLIPPTLPSSALGEGPYRLSNIVVIGAIGPLAEEVFFRGFLLAALVQGLGLAKGVLLGSAIFALSHPVLGVMLPVFVSGLLLSWLYLKTQSIWPPFTAHAAQNLIAMAMTG